MTNYVAIGVDLGGTKLLIVSGEECIRVPTGASFTSAQVEDQVRQFLDKFDGIPGGIGIAIPGLVDHMGCVVACDVLPEIVGWYPAQALADINCPIKVINDVKAALLEEFHDAEPKLTAGVVMIGTAVGAAFLTEGLPIMGARGWAGELGYIPIALNGGVKRLNELAGGSFMAKRLGTDSQTLVLRAQAGDEAALSVIREGGYAFGLALATVINLLNPSRLALGGGTLELKGFEEAAYEAAKHFSLPELWAACRLSKVKSGDAVVALGARRFVELQ